MLVKKNPQISEINAAVKKLETALHAFFLETYGTDAVEEAWEEFSLHSQADQSAPEYTGIFPIWLLYSWQSFASEEMSFSLDLEDDFDPSIAIQYIAEKGSTLTPFEWQFIQAATEAPFTVYAIESYDDNQLMLHDLMQGQTFPAHCLSATFPKAREGDIIYAQVLSLDGEHYIHGIAPFAVDALFAEDFQYLKEEIQNEFPEISNQSLCQHTYAIREYFYGVLMEENDPEKESQIIPTDPLLEEDEFFDLEDADFNEQELFAPSDKEP